jgi:uroporphyrinogen-III synthase
MSSAALTGRRILVTRRPEQSARLARALREHGAEVVEVPLLELAPPLDPAPLEAALRSLGEYDWIAFTSANAVRAVAAGAASAAWPRVASVGPATSEVIRELRPGGAIDREPPLDYRAEGLLAAFSEADVVGRRFLLPLSDRARDVLADGLLARGAHVDRVVAYRTVAPAEAGPAVNWELSQGVDLVTFASPSAIDSFVTLAPDHVAGTRVAVLGPVTAARAAESGLNVVAVAQPSTVEALVDAIVRALA